MAWRGRLTAGCTRVACKGAADCSVPGECASSATRLALMSNTGSVGLSCEPPPLLRGDGKQVSPDHRAATALRHLLLYANTLHAVSFTTKTGSPDTVR